MYIVMQQVLLLLLFAAVGYIMCKTGKANSGHTKLISALQVYVFLPCTVINTYSANFTIPYIREKYPLLLSSFVILAIMIVVSDLLSRVLAEKGYLTFSGRIPRKYLEERCYGLTEGGSRQ